MSGLKPINADPATKAAVAAYASERGISQTKALAALIAFATSPTQPPYPVWELVACLDDRLPDDLFTRITRMARERSQSPAETLSAALDALAKPTGIVTPQPRTEPVWEGGVTPCRCDGPETVGSHHRTGCHNRRDQ